VVITDNGRGIPIRHEETTGLPVPLLAWTRAKAGSNFDDEGRTTIGMNGIGSFATNVLSKEFHAETCDGKQLFSLKCSNNMSTVEHSIKKVRRDSYTRVEFEPDFQRFEDCENGFCDEVSLMFKTRVAELSMALPQITFTFNKEKLKPKSFKEWCGTYFQHFEYVETKNVKICVMENLSEDFNFIHFVNGVDAYAGGNILEWTLTSVINSIKDALPKQYRNVKPGDIKNKIGMALFISDMVDAKFDSQTKSQCINSPTEFKSIFADVDFDKLGKAISKNAELSSPIVDYIKFKEEFRERQELKSIGKKISLKKINKFYQPIGAWKYLVLAEGDSAAGGLMSVLGRGHYGYFPLRGKSLNCLDVSMSRIGSNNELGSILSILNLDITGKSCEITFENVLIATDADMDGISIKGLLLTFFYRVSPELLKSGKVKFLKTPLITLYKKGEIYQWFFTMSEYNDWCEKNKGDMDKYKHQYYKGLGTWKDVELKKLFDKYGVDKFIFECILDEGGKDCLINWMGKSNANIRKELQANMNFDVNSI
jgi:DNA topoisomerase-2